MKVGHGCSQSCEERAISETLHVADYSKINSMFHACDYHDLIMTQFAVRTNTSTFIYLAVVTVFTSLFIVV